VLDGIADGDGVGEADGVDVAEGVDEVLVVGCGVGVVAHAVSIGPTSSTAMSRDPLRSMIQR
jgi:hypothetical protein